MVEAVSRPGNNLSSMHSVHSSNRVLSERAAANTSERVEGAVEDVKSEEEILDKKQEFNRADLQRINKHLKDQGPTQQRGTVLDTWV